MGRRARVERTPEQKWEIVLEGLKSGNIAETCRRYEIAPNLYYRWKDEAQQGATAALGGKSAAALESEKDRRWDGEIIAACGAKPAYGYRRVTWWLRRKEGLRVNRKRVLRVMREQGLLVPSRRLRARRRKEWGRVEAWRPNQIWQADLTKIWSGPTVGWAYLVSVIDGCTREIVGRNLSARCRTQEALAAVEQAVLERLPAGSRGAGLTLTTDNGTQFTSTRFLETLAGLGITYRRTAYHHPEGNSYIERFHRSLKEEEVGLAEYRYLEEARESIGRYLWEYNHDRPHRGLRDGTPREAFVDFQSDLKIEALRVQISGEHYIHMYIFTSSCRTPGESWDKALAGPLTPAKTRECCGKRIETIGIGREARGRIKLGLQGTLGTLPRTCGKNLGGMYF